ncbi:MAG: hypothetical protein N0A16_06885 [Blastocatellia bacterium]|nr:hypothetical protein [Blastocatellia bacterium]
MTVAGAPKGEAVCADGEPLVDPGRAEGDIARMDDLGARTVSESRGKPLGEKTSRAVRMLNRNIPGQDA